MWLLRAIAGLLTRDEAPSLKSMVAKGDGGNGGNRGGHAQLGSLVALPSHRGPRGQKGSNVRDENSQAIADGN